MALTLRHPIRRWIPYLLAQVLAMFFAAYETGAQVAAREQTESEVSDSKGEPRLNPAREFYRSLRELSASDLSPEERVRALVEWKQRNQDIIVQMTAPKARLGGGQFPTERREPDLSSFAGSDDEATLIHFHLMVANQLLRLHVRSLDPEQRVSAIEDFIRQNGQGFREANELSEKLITEKVVSGKVALHLDSLGRLSQEEGVLVANEAAVQRELLDLRERLGSLTSLERLAELSKFRVLVEARLQLIDALQRIRKARD